MVEMDDPSELPATCWFERSTDLQRHPAQAILSATLDALVVIDTAGAVVEWNPLATEIFGYARGLHPALSFGHRNSSASFSDGFIHSSVCRGRSLSM
ncbi:MAG TPA: PAS domain S-box protein [Myxococcales bacterium]|nr:PAS domain S-box protein [Myxococcales bacterium]